MQRNRRKKSRRGFTLIELMVVVTIIAILAALIVPALQKAQAKSMSMRCLATGRSIAATLRAYASNWNGWTNSDTDYYVKEFGYNLTSDQGYFGEPAGSWSTDTASQSYQHALRIRDFRCPVDEAPPNTGHIIPSSFGVTTFFAGRNIMNMTDEANRTLAVRELGSKRHPAGGNDEMERNYIFADLSATLGYNGPVFPGWILRAWNKGSVNGIQGVAESALPTPDFETIGASSLWLDYRWAETLYGKVDKKGIPNDWHHATYTPGTYPVWGWGTNHIYPFPNVTARVDGFIKFPRAGYWEFRASGAYALNACTFGISQDGGSPTALADTTNFTTNTKGYTRYWWNDAYTQINVSDANNYYKFYGVYLGHTGNGGAQGEFGLRLRTWVNPNDTSSGYDSNLCDVTYGTAVSGSNLFWLP